MSEGATISNIPSVPYGWQTVTHSRVVHVTEFVILPCCFPPNASTEPAVSADHHQGRSHTTEERGAGQRGQGLQQVVHIV
jgi:hypothetical protein